MYLPSRVRSNSASDPLPWADRIVARLFGNVPDEVADQLLLRQYDALRGLVPVLYLTIAVNAIAAGVAARHNLPPLFQFALPVVFLMIAVVRVWNWRGQRSASVAPQVAARHLRTSTWLAIPISLIGGVTGAAAYLLVETPNDALPCMFMTMAIFAGAACLSTLPRAASITIVLGLLPICTAMLLVGNVEIRAIAISTLVGGLLQLRLVWARFDETIATLLLQHQTHELAETDSLTGLRNRRAFTQALEEEVQDRSDNRRFAVVMLDLDGFKPANDRYGHAVGDLVLMEVASRLRTLCCTARCVARIGGDEFAVIFETGWDDAMFHEKAAAIRTLLSMPYALDHWMVSISASVGLACFPTDGRTAAGLINAADRALYAEKAARFEPPAVDDGQISLFG